MNTPPRREEAPQTARSAADSSRIAALLLMVAVLCLWTWSTCQTEHVFDGLSEADRHAIHDRAMQNLRTVCEDASRAEPADFCGAEARNVVRSGACDAGCRARVASWSVTVTR